jgi:hypothetical protein
MSQNLLNFTCHPKEGVLRIFITLKSIALAKFEPATLGTSGKHDNHYTTNVTAFGASENNNADQSGE